MSRRRVAAKRETLPDPKYHSEMLAKFINHIMLDGKKSIAEKIVYNAIKIIIEKSKKTVASADEHQEDDGGRTDVSKKRDKKNNTDHETIGLDVLEQALENIRPTVEVRPRRVGGATYQVPMEVRPDRQNTLAMRWLVSCARSRSEKGMALRLAYEVLDALANRGSAVKKREEMHRMAKANQAFAHFRWN